jgi:hypothetical protein
VEVRLVEHEVVLAESLAEKATAKAAKLRLGLAVFGGLLALTVVEWWAASAFRPATPVLAGLALGKTWLILEYYMHFHQVRRGEE